jgi:stalled ribosome rescue protein Dom34
VSDFRHAIVWIDHSEATVARFRGYEESDVEVHSHTSLQRLHHLRTGWEAGGISPPDTEFYQRIVGVLDPNSDLVITGPGNAKAELKTYIDQHRPHIAARVVEADKNDQPPATELRALWRRSFTARAAPPPSGDGVIPARAL